MLVKVEIESPDGEYKWYDLYSDTPGKAVLQVETGVIYGDVAMREDDPHTYEECDDPNYVEEDHGMSEEEERREYERLRIKFENEE